MHVCSGVSGMRCSVLLCVVAFVFVVLYVVVC